VTLDMQTDGQTGRLCRSKDAL